MRQRGYVIETETRELAEAFVQPLGSLPWIEMKILRAASSGHFAMAMMVELPPMQRL